MVGARIVKTFVAVTLSILIAKALNLHTFQFAGIVAVLSVQPSIYRTLRDSARHTASAIMGAVLGAAGLFLLDEKSFLVMGLVAFVLMVIHARLKWTNSLLLSVVIAINTMGATELGFWESAWNQICLVLIGTIVGTLVNLVRKPVHQERAEVSLLQAEGMLRAMLHYLYLDLDRKQITPYESLKEQIDDIGAYIRSGKEISRLVQEDRRFRKTPFKNTSSIFRSFESMLEKIHGMATALGKIEWLEEELVFSKKSLSLLIRIQENIIQGKRRNLRPLKRAIDRKRDLMWQSSGESQAYYLFYGYVTDYLQELERFLAANAGRAEKTLVYTSVDRPGLIAEISAILAKYDMNIQDVSIRVSGEFAGTTMKVSGPANAESGRIAGEIRKVDHVLSVEWT